MREIRFRAWDQELRSFIYFVKPDQISFWKNVSKFNLPVNEFIGIFDKNGMEIHEGDIIKCYDYYEWRNSAVVYNEKYAVFTASSRHIHGMGRDSGKPLFINPRTSTVIGNIYENPELLEKKP